MNTFDPKIVTEQEHGVVRFFAVVRPLDLKRGDTFTIPQIAKALGVTSLNENDVQQIWTDDLVGTSIGGILIDGYGVQAEDVERHRAEIEGAEELHPTIFILIRTSAFTARPAVIVDDGPINLIATLREPSSNVTFEPLPNPDPVAVLQDAPTKKKPSDAAMGGRVATIALVVMGLLVWVMIKVGG